MYRDSLVRLPRYIRLELHDCDSTERFGGPRVRIGARERLRIATAVERRDECMDGVVGPHEEKLHGVACEVEEREMYRPLLPRGGRESRCCGRRTRRRRGLIVRLRA